MDKRHVRSKSGLEPGKGFGRFLAPSEPEDPGQALPSKPVGRPRADSRGHARRDSDSKAQPAYGTFAGLPAARPSALPGMVMAGVRVAKAVPWWILLLALLVPAGVVRHGGVTVVRAQEPAGLDMPAAPALSSAGLGAGPSSFSGAPAFFPASAGALGEGQPAQLASVGIATGGRQLQAPATVGGTGISTSAPGPASIPAPDPSAVSKYGPNERLVFWDEFSELDLKSRWKPEITMGGFGNWEFEVYMNNRSNLFVKDGQLYLKPGLLGLPEAQLQTGYTLDLWGSDPPSLCTMNQFWGCVRTSGAGGAILNPVTSARIRSAEFFSFKYGRVEVRAKLPRGDWLWPAIWLLPRHQAYGPWPASGEIDVMESRGNAPSYPAGGCDTFGSTLHVGPYTTGNMWQQFHQTYKAPSGQPSLADGFHIYGLKWSPLGLYTYIDDPANVVLRANWDNPAGQFARGDFGPGVDNPWEGAPNTAAAPFDQEFYLIMNVAVGGTAGGAQGYFPDGQGGKPWSNVGDKPMNAFWAAKDAWYPTWQGDGAAMVVDYVRVWQDATGTEGATASGEWVANSKALGAMSQALGAPGTASTAARPQEAGTPGAAGTGAGRLLQAGVCEAVPAKVQLTVNVVRDGQ